MLRIRDEQVLTLRRALTADVEDELFEDIKRFFRERHTFLGDDQTRAVVRYGMERAVHHGFTSKRGLALYVTLAFILGSHFDDNPLYPWVWKNLVPDRDLVETTRTHRFYNALRRHLRAARDETGVYNEPILRYPEEPFVPTAGGTTVNEQLVEHLRAIAPAPFHEAGQDQVHALVRLAIERAGARGIMSGAGLGVYVPLTFLLGVGFDDDLQFPWATEGLEPQDGDGPEAASLRLHEAALAFRRHTLTFVAEPPAPSRG